MEKKPELPHRDWDQDQWSWRTVDSDTPQGNQRLPVYHTTGSTRQPSV